MKLEEKTKIREFYQQFDDLDSQIEELDIKIQNRNNLERSLNTKRFMQQVLTGLEETKKQEDPGKCGRAFYFVAGITQNDIVESDRPSIYKPCPECGKLQPILMWYEQTFDSPDGDVWEKEAFIMCRDGVYKLAHVANDHRF